MRLCSLLMPRVSRQRLDKRPRACGPHGKGFGMKPREGQSFSVLCTHGIPKWADRRSLHIVVTLHHGELVRSPRVKRRWRWVRVTSSTSPSASPERVTTCGVGDTIPLEPNNRDGLGGSSLELWPFRCPRTTLLTYISTVWSAHVPVRGCCDDRDDRTCAKL